MSDASSQSQGVPSPVDFVALSAGRTIGRYEVVSVLGQGGFGITYRARDSQLGREVAIKEYLPLALAVRQDGTTVLPRSTGAAEDFTWGRERFVAEGRTLASLQDAPAIVRVFDFLEANGTAYIVMQLLAGETLESRLKRNGPLKPAEIDRILWPLLDGLERVHNAGFLHRDIKPANILLDDAGNPTLIDFGASRAAIAGRSTALTAIFTPGYAAAEQMTSAKQGPWTDIYGLSATLYHAITGQTPPSAFDRMLDDACEPLGKKAPPDFARGLLAGIDAGLAVRASDRPQSIAGWRPILGQVAALAGDATVVLVPPSAAPSPAVVEPTAEKAAAPARRRGIGLWIGAAAAAIMALAGGYYALVDAKRVTPQVAAAPGPSAVDKAAQDAQLAAEAQRLKDQEELAKLRTAAAAREKAEQEAAQRRQIEEETRRRIEAEMAEKKRLEDEARQKAEADAAADRRAAEMAENGLRLTTLDRQHVQVALGALGFGGAGTDGFFRPRTREVIAAWQKAHDKPPTGYLTGEQNQALLRDAAPAVSHFDEEQKKAAAPPPQPPPPPAEPPQMTAVAPPPAATTPPVPAPSGSAAAGDGIWQGTYDCQAGRDAAAAPPFTSPFRAMVTNGHGVWVPQVSRGTLSIALQITGDSVRFARTVAVPFQGKSETYLTGKLSGASITASGHEQPFGRYCTVVLGRVEMPAGAQPSGAGSAGSGAHRRPRN
jgi:serine/threonine protein kinase/peptidoglycan hydrolase-like protein with peptidoglycan-binding domain